MKINGATEWRQDVVGKIQRQLLSEATSVTPVGSSQGGPSARRGASSLMSRTAAITKEPSQRSGCASRRIRPRQRDMHKQHVCNTWHGQHQIVDGMVFKIQSAFRNIRFQYLSIRIDEI